MIFVGQRKGLRSLADHCSIARTIPHTIIPTPIKRTVAAMQIGHLIIYHTDHGELVL